MAGYCLVCPASRGIGFSLARHLLQHTKLPVVATARKNLAETRERLNRGIDSERLSVVQVDMKDESSISALATHLRKRFPEEHLRLAFTLPGILHVEKSPSQIDSAAALETFTVNTLGPLLLLKHLTPLLPTKGAEPFAPHTIQKGVVALSSPHAVYSMMAARVGSISDNRLGGWYSYRASKAAVFQLAKTLDLYLKTRSGDRAMAVALHPGTVRTDFTREYWGGREMLDADEAARRLVEVVDRLGVGDGGKCWDWRGEEVLP
ncbi:hypothetical protein ASPZODRAFT_149606 [Penicilliopsis zonata CBS 506.65]|uniref:Uncharacterized protein n=1 Tax=Penicilliopsis zonata CBS 506.65 TaxID=1073090 RepID=A0A1L9SSP3_9EURO|nr:hypothetical protein ASPZODRAFT_149606 [Penicilliopsis zonata CBS 506.65]OJJ50230.1 hypothetical protein ASPZODRAFT_149606 [Penicilliopsis zonata CBS 506.65]